MSKSRERKLEDAVRLAVSLVADTPRDQVDATVWQAWLEIARSALKEDE